MHDVPTPLAAADVVAFRRRLGVSQTELASSLGVSMRGIQEWEAGRREPPAYLRLAMAALISGAQPWRAEPTEVLADGDAFRVHYAAAGGVVVRQRFATHGAATRFARFWVGEPEPV